MSTKCSTQDCDRCATVHFTSPDREYVYGLCRYHYTMFNNHLIIDALYSPVTITKESTDHE